MGISKKTFAVFLPHFLLACLLTGHVHAAASSSDTEESGQQWQEPYERADLLLFSAHADDEHLFFAGILPYCVANGIKAQVVYMTNHDDNPVRNGERLDGLWAVGIRNKPVVAHFPDLYSESLDGALETYGRNGCAEDDFIAFYVSNIRRFKPQVAVGHDIGGEYGHGAHSLSASVLMKAVGLAGDSSYHGESAAQYGLWDVPKTYLHLWKEREIGISIDEPLPYFDGKTAFQVSQHGFSFHKSQHWMYFYKWLKGTAEAPITASGQIRNYPPGKFGLYRSLVGVDSEGAKDFFENIVLIKDATEDLYGPGTSGEIAPGESEGEKSESGEGGPGGIKPGRTEGVLETADTLKRPVTAPVIVAAAALLLLFIAAALFLRLFIKNLKKNPKRRKQY